MDYANEGNLRGNLTRISKSDWNQKLYMLFEIISGLNNIHKKELIHCDFHDGNILNHSEGRIYISDLGLCKPVKSYLKEYNIYGVIPFMAPEVLRGNPYTPASDMYGFSMIMWEFTSGKPPFNNIEHDFQLSLSICEGERPKIIENTPQCYVELMKKCWDETPLKRPSSEEVLNIINKWMASPYNVKDINEELKYNIMEFINAPIGHNNNIDTGSHSQAYYKSRLLDFTSKQLNEILESRYSQANIKVNESEELDDFMI
ncbi:kinase-like domain-containing protein [Rhizophagus irregularis DAOM 181602=DAOM 197198]|nr:kinase-like domain-containing protein [Rhizophagus irregularis DAOM 181602=DAOM 197198]POG83018.1 kinase-like domain-containing protein [Rhizophagus irregularis DAOM 181602=DAOM 197198]|eukprot:XP_025189884.1 kinase-like domain-containing protein [Rhizophagus irregularis DAOM 181602=DAOM 197198]